MSTAAIADSKWFGAGYIYGIQSVAPGGVQDTLLLPGNFATIQEANVEISKTVKELRGAYEDPEDIADGPRKVTGKITTGRVNLQQLNNLVFEEPGGGNFTTGTLMTVNFEADTIPGSSPYAVTVQEDADFYQDLGVMFAGTRLALIPTATYPPAEGEYYCDADTGIYTFDVADKGKDVLISYQYSVAASGHTLTVHNLIMGSSRPGFQALFMNPYDGDNELFLFYCKATKVGVPIKSEDYTKLEIDFQAAADVNGNMLQWLSSY